MLTKLGNALISVITFVVWAIAKVAYGLLILVMTPLWLLAKAAEFAHVPYMENFVPWEEEMKIIKDSFVKF